VPSDLDFLEPRDFAEVAELAYEAWPTITDGRVDRDCLTTHELALCWALYVSTGIAVLEKEAQR
jgi:hypothetical protein